MLTFVLLFIIHVPVHYSIDKRRNEVLERRQKVKDRAADRHNALLAAQGFQEFKRDSDEVNMMYSLLLTAWLNLWSVKGVEF